MPDTPERPQRATRGNRIAQVLAESDSDLPSDWEVGSTGGKSDVTYVTSSAASSDTLDSDFADSEDTGQLSSDAPEDDVQLEREEREQRRAAKPAYMRKKVGPAELTRTLRIRPPSKLSQEERMARAETLAVENTHRLTETEAVMRSDTSKRSGDVQRRRAARRRAVVPPCTVTNRDCLALHCTAVLCLPEGAALFDQPTRKRARGQA